MTELFRLSRQQDADGKPGNNVGGAGLRVIPGPYYRPVLILGAHLPATRAAAIATRPGPAARQSRQL